MGLDALFTAAINEAIDPDGGLNSVYGAAQIDPVNRANVKLGSGEGAGAAVNAGLGAAVEDIAMAIPTALSAGVGAAGEWLSSTFTGIGNFFTNSNAFVVGASSEAGAAGFSGGTEGSILTALEKSGIEATSGAVSAAQSGAMAASEGTFLGTTARAVGTTSNAVSSAAAAAEPFVSAANTALKVGSIGMSLYGGIAGYSAVKQGAESEASLLEQQANEARVIGSMKTSNANIAANIAQTEAEMAASEADIAAKGAGIQADEADVAKGRAEIAKDQIGIAAGEAAVASAQADIAEKEVGMHGLRIGVMQNELERGAEAKAKEATSAKGKARASAAGRGVMLESRAEAAPSMEEQDIAAEAAWAIGQMASKTHDQQQLQLEAAKISSMEAKVARMRAGIAGMRVGIAQKEASLAYKRAAMAYKGAGIAYDRALVTSKRPGIAALQANVARRNALITETNSLFEPEYLDWKARATRTTGNLQATNTLISGLSNAAIGTAGLIL